MRHLRPTCGNMWGDEERRRVEGSKGATCTVDAPVVAAGSARDLIQKPASPQPRLPHAKQEFAGKLDHAARPDCDDWMRPLTLSEGIRFPMPAEKSLITVPETDGGMVEA